MSDVTLRVRGASPSTASGVRRTILAVIPDAEECTSYGLPAFRVDGAVVAGFQATAKGCSYYPFSGQTLTTLARILYFD